MDTKSCTHPSTKKHLRKGQECPSIHPETSPPMAPGWFRGGIGTDEVAGFNLVDKRIILLLALWMQKLVLRYKAESGRSKTGWEATLHWYIDINVHRSRDNTALSVGEKHMRNKKRKGFRDLIPIGMKFSCNPFSWIFITARTNTVSWEFMLKI